MSGSKDLGVIFWDRTGTAQCLLRGHLNSVISIALSPGGDLLATGSGDWQAKICECNFWSRSEPYLVVPIREIWSLLMSWHSIYTTCMYD